MSKILPEALENFTKEELALHNQLKEIDEMTLTNYVLKRAMYKDVDKTEMDHLNDIYESGSTEFKFKILTKDHTLKLLTQKEKSDVNKFVDNLLNGPDKEVYFTEEERKLAGTSYRATALVALATIALEDTTIKSVIERDKLVDSLETRYRLFNAMSPIIIQTLYDKYNEFESRMYNIFQAESVRKKA